jgi:Fur family ferric uptake transcriptional regulator
LFKRVSEKHPSIGHATVFRTMKLLKEADLAREISLGDKKTRFEHNFGHKHHDHLVCRACGRVIEVLNDKIEELQEKLCREHGFLPEQHHLEIFGLCRECQKKKKEK